MLERRVLDDGLTVLVSTELEREGFLVAFTERTGGVSLGPFASLNLGFTAGDDPDRVRENRARVCGALGIERFARAWQVHGAEVAEVTPGLADAGFAEADTAIPDTDAMVTSATGVALSVLTADCVPVALADPEAGRLGVVHAGWRGLVAGVVTEALRRFPDPAAVVSLVGPAVGPDHYPVGPDVAQAVERAAGRSAMIRRGAGGRIAVDLSATVAGVLEASGATVVDRVIECAACEAARFFSHRRDGDTGRQALIAMRR
jgi:purine-nucleoside/S-methyl-5'-thioadenosine phosphorylase / adenosine deaminase